MIMVQHLVAANAHTFVNASNAATASPSPSPPASNGHHLHSPLASPTASTSSTSQQTIVSSPLSSPNAAGDMVDVVSKLSCNLNSNHNSNSSSIASAVSHSMSSPREDPAKDTNWCQSPSIVRPAASTSPTIRPKTPSAICEEDEEEDRLEYKDTSQSPQHTPSTSPALSHHSASQAQQNILDPSASANNEQQRENSHEANTISTCRQKFAVLYNHLRQQQPPSRHDSMDVESTPAPPQQQPARRSVITSREEEDSLSEERSASATSVEHLQKDLDEPRHYHPHHHHQHVHHSHPPSDHYHSDEEEEEEEDFDDEVPLDLSLPTKLARSRARTYSGSDSDDSGSGVHDAERGSLARRLKPEERKAAYKKSLMKRYCKC